MASDGSFTDLSSTSATGSQATFRTFIDPGTGLYEPYVKLDGGGGGGGGGGAVTIADGADVTLGAKGDASASSDSGTFSLIALTKRGLGSLSVIAANQSIQSSSLSTINGGVNNVNAGISTANSLLTPINNSLSDVDGKFPAKGAATTANSLPVNIASDQIVPVSATSLPLPAGASTAANQASEISSLATVATNTTPPTVTAFRNTSVSSTATQVKGSAGTLWGWNFVNTNTVPVYLKFYDALAVNVTVGTTTPTTIKAVPANSVFYLPKSLVPHGNFSTAITVAAVTGIADNSTTAPSTGLYVEMGYQ